ARARGAGESVDLLPARTRAGARAERGGGPGRARLDDRPRGGAPRSRSRDALPAQVLSLVPRQAGARVGHLQASPGVAAAGRDARAGQAVAGLRARAGSRRGLSGPPLGAPLYCCAAEAAGPATSPLAGGFFHLGTSTPNARSRVTCRRTSSSPQKA